MGTQRWWQVRRSMRQARLDRVLDDWQRDFERSRTEVLRPSTCSASASMANFMRPLPSRPPCSRR